ncbi:MAG TPA: ribonuclease III [Longilinea sp.]|nr:ribonuclease III [Longilinea sp.]
MDRKLPELEKLRWLAPPEFREEPVDLLPNPAGLRETPQELAARLNLKFNDWLLLSRALTHRSYLNEHSEALEDNERLEFLGDAVLDFTVGAWLYNRYPEMHEGDLTRMRSALVHTEQLAEFARQIDLGGAMRLGRGETAAGGRERPALLCDTFEAVVGAIYLDTGIDGVMHFIGPLLESSSDEILANRKNEDSKSMLQEWAQSQGFPAPQYITRSATGPDHSKMFAVDVLITGEVKGSGMGHSKQAAAKVAAQDALIHLGLMD